MKIKMLAAALLLFTGVLAFTQEPKKPEPCEDAQTQGDMNVCWARQYREADARLNQIYRQFMAKLDDQEKIQLKNAQTAWLKYRDVNCEFVSDQYKGGTMRPMIAGICLTDVTDNRTKELSTQMKDREDH